MSRQRAVQPPELLADYAPQFLCSPGLRLYVWRYNALGDRVLTFDARSERVLVVDDLANCESCTVWLPPLTHFPLSLCLQSDG